MKKFFFLLLWAVACYRALGQVPYPAAPVPAAPVIKAEYFFDTDPGFGMAAAIVITPATDINSLLQALALNGTGLENGIHRLYLRTQNADGVWSLTQTEVFENFVVRPYATAAPALPVTEMEYFFDADPGLGNGIHLNVAPHQNISNATAVINISELSKGVHRLYVRAKDEAGRWSLTNVTLFDNVALEPYPAGAIEPQVFSHLEYFIDTDPGIGNGTALPLTAATNLDGFSINLPVGSLASGTHTLYLRSNAGLWSHTAYADFSVDGVLPLQWLYVQGRVQQQQALLNWSTAQEVNTKYFLIEHSTNGVDFNVVGKLDALGSKNANSYNFTHQKMAGGFNYYRIKQTDVDGRFSYSKIITLLNKSGLSNFAIGPNPVHNSLTVVLPESAIAELLEVFTTAGVRVISVRPEPGAKTCNINVKGLPNGTYLMRVTNRQGIETKTFIKN